MEITAICSFGHWLHILAAVPIDRLSLLPSVRAWNEYYYQPYCWI